MTSAGLAEHIKRECELTGNRFKSLPLRNLELHLRRYHQDRLEYLSSYQRRLNESSRSVVPTLTTPLRSFSKLNDIGGYCDVSITDDFITDIYLKFSQATRVEESNEHLRTLTGMYRVYSLKLCRKLTLPVCILAVSISIDQTFRAAGKAKLVNSSHKHEKTWGGGILNALNERGQTLAWVSASPAPMLV